MRNFTQLIFATFFLLFVSTGLFAQEIYFCESVDENGNPGVTSHTFNISRSGSYLDILVKLPYKVDCDFVSFEIYRLDENGKEVYDNTYDMDTQYDWTWFYKQITFYKEGKYKIYVYDCLEELIVSGELKIQYRD